MKVVSVASFMSLASLTSLIAAGCSLSPSTSQLDVDEIAAFYVVNASDDATEVRAQFFQWRTFPECGRFVVGNCGGEGTDGALEVIDDRVTVTHNDDTQELVRDEASPESPIYTANVAAPQTDDTIVFTLERADGPALDTSITLPPPPVVGEVPEIFARPDGLTIVAEEDFGADILSGKLVAPTNCLSSLSTRADNERLSFSFQGETSDQNCDVTLTIGRLRSRAGNPAFAQADVEAQRVLAPVTIRSTP
jgi:hypothetical protein